jgi:hypothetical protein
MNVGQLVDQLMGDEADFNGEVVSAEAAVAVLLPDGTIISLDKVEYEPHEDGTLGGTLWLRGDYA